MNKLPNIELNDKQVHELVTRDKLFTGAEAFICESGKDTTLCKIFSRDGKVIPMGDNKENKIIKLHQMQLEHSVKPISTISSNGIIIGYEMSTDSNLRTYKSYQLSRDELLYILKETKNILEYFSSKGIIYGDIDFRNILFNRNSGEIQFCDMDNTQIGEYKMDLTPYGLLSYDFQRGIDDGVHPFMHNRMLLATYGEDIYYIRNHTIRFLFKYPAKSIISSMKNPEDFRNEYLIDYMKKLNR